MQTKTLKYATLISIILSRLMGTLEKSGLKQQQFV